MAKSTIVPLSLFSEGEWSQPQPETHVVTLETTVAYPGKWREKDGERMIMFSIPTHLDLLPHLPKPPKTVNCFYRNLRFKYSTLTTGTAIRLTASIDFGKRGGISLHLHNLEVIGQPVQNLTKVPASMMKKWTKNIEKQNASAHQTAVNSVRS